MKLHYEWGSKQLHKKNEELCGDSLAVSRSSDSVTVALSFAHRCQRRWYMVRMRLKKT